METEQTRGGGALRLQLQINGCHYYDRMVVQLSRDTSVMKLYRQVWKQLALPNMFLIWVPLFRGAVCTGWNLLQRDVSLSEALLHAKREPPSSAKEEEEGEGEEEVEVVNLRMDVLEGGNFTLRGYKDLSELSMDFFLDVFSVSTSSSSNKNNSNQQPLRRTLLKRLTLSHNGLTRCSFCPMNAQLFIVDLSFNALSAIPEGFCLKDHAPLFAHVKELSLASNRWIEEVPSEFCLQLAATTITDLDLSNNAIRALPKEMGRLVYLRRLNLSINRIRTIPTEMGALRYLSILDLSHNYLGEEERERESEWGLVSPLPEQALQGWMALKELDLSWNRLTELPQQLGCMTDLEVLRLEHNCLTRFPEGLSNLHDLLYLDLQSNRITTTRNTTEFDENKLRNLQPLFHSEMMLESLNLNNNCLTELPASVCKLRHLKKLYLSANQLTALPSRIYKLRESLMTLDLSCNHLCTLPPSISYMTCLVGLNIANNSETENETEEKEKEDKERRSKDENLADSLFLAMLPSVGAVRLYYSFRYDDEQQPTGKMNENEALNAVPAVEAEVQGQKQASPPLLHPKSKQPSQQSLLDEPCSPSLILSTEESSSPPPSLKQQKEDQETEEQDEPQPVQQQQDLDSLPALLKRETDLLLIESGRMKPNPFPYKISMDNVQIRRKLYQGSSSIVYEAEWRGLDCAVKHYLLPPPEENLAREAVISKFCKEAGLLSYLKRKHLFKDQTLYFVGASVTLSYLAIISELAICSLHDVLYPSKEPSATSSSLQLSFDERMFIAYQIAQALEELHDSSKRTQGGVDIIHNALHSRNILIMDDKLTVKLSGFGHSNFLSYGPKGEWWGDDFIGGTTLSRSLRALHLQRLQNPTCENTTSSFDCLAPECKAKGIFHASSDMYSFGLLLRELFRLDDEKGEGWQMTNQQREAVEQLVQDLCQERWEARWNAGEVVEWMKKMSHK